LKVRFAKREGSRTYGGAGPAHRLRDVLDGANAMQLAPDDLERDGQADRPKKHRIVASAREEQSDTPRRVDE
jgi:hypothetical protein